MTHRITAKYEIKAELFRGTALDGPAPSGKGK